ncbi:MAG: hypothetical protein IJY28_08045 [Clostridia bacterium]|nr:hypothetical protein [Clostridia bacterium]
MKTTKRKKLFALFLALTLLLLTGCTTDPASSNPSSDMPSSTTQPSSEPSSSALSSNPSTSSEPELPPLNLSMPMNGESMQSTISPWGYVDCNGNFHYSPEWDSLYDTYWPTTQKDIQNITDGTSGVKSISWVMQRADTYDFIPAVVFVLMQDGSLCPTSVYPLGDYYESAVYQNGSDVVYGIRSGNDFPDIFALKFTEKDGASYSYTSYDCWMPGKTDHIVSFEYISNMYLYTDGSIGFTKYEFNTAANQFPSTEFSSWNELVQIESIFYRNGSNVPNGIQNDQIIAFGLKKDGTVLCTSDVFLPVKYRSNVVRMFDCYIQHRDGSVYDLSNRKELGQFAKMDQIFPCGPYVLGVDTTGKVHCLSHKVEDISPDSAAAWACTLTNVKTVWND